MAFQLPGIAGLGLLGWDRWSGDRWSGLAHSSDCVALSWIAPAIGGFQNSSSEALRGSFSWAALCGRFLFAAQP
jgi:hypothetical protein